MKDTEVSSNPTQEWRNFQKQVTSHCIASTPASHLAISRHITNTITPTTALAFLFSLK